MSFFSKELEAFINQVTWTYAKTMPEWPHEYIVKNNVDNRYFESIVHHIRKNGQEEFFYQKTLVYYHQDGLVYWTMGAPVDETIIVNRCKEKDTYENRLKFGRLPNGEIKNT